MRLPKIPNTAGAGFLTGAIFLIAAWFLALKIDGNPREAGISVLWWIGGFLTCSILLSNLNRGTGR